MEPSRTPLSPERLVHRAPPPRSISLPKYLTKVDNKRSVVLGDAKRSLRGPLFANGLRMLSESRSLDPHRGEPGLAELLCADLDVSGLPASPDRSLSTRLERLSISQTPNYGSSACLRALGCNDILHVIIEHLDGMNVVPHEFSQRRRKPMSLKHAQLIYGDRELARDAWEKAQNMSPSTLDRGPAAGVFSCLLVNKQWFYCAMRVLESKIHFADKHRFRQLVCRPSLSRKPKLFVLHKLSDAQQLELERIDSCIGGALELLELYTCPNLLPTPSLLEGGHLKKLVLPGCGRVNDRTMAYVAELCPRLEHLDLRACELVSDAGLKLIAKYCPELSLINVGRSRGGELVTYKGVKHLARQTKLTTLGLAGCSIDDRALWELALDRGPHLQRLSLNNCKLLTDASVPRILGYTPNLSVLEIRGCLQLTNMRPLVLFKRYREYLGYQPLIEGCEILEWRLKLAAKRLRHDINQQIIADCEEWVNAPVSDAD